MMWLQFIYVGIGGAIGCMLRYGATVIANMASWSQVITTLAVNALGSFLIGGLFTCVHRQSLYALLITGICGGFTTFSTFSLQAVQLLQQGKHTPAILYMLASLLICIACTYIGLVCGNKFIK